jgi:hypothetical protein
MAQTGFTPIQLYSTSTAAAAPVAGNLTNSTLGSELAINITDGKLFYKDNANAVQVIGWKTVPTTAGGTGLTTYTAGDLSYYASGTTFTKLAIGTTGQILSSTGSAPQWTTLSGVAVTTFSAGTTGFTPNSATSGAITLAGTLITSNGGTGLSSYTAGDLSYYASGTALTKLAIGATGRFLSSTGSAPQWSAPAALTEVDDTNVTMTLGGTPSTALLSSVSMTLGWTGTLAVGRGGTGISTLTANYIPYGNGTSAFQSSANLQFNGTNLGVGGSFTNTVSSGIAINNATAGSFPGLEIQTAGTTRFFINATNGASYLSSVGTNPMVFFTNSVEAARIQSSGGVSIGTTSDPGAGGLFVNTQIATFGSQLNIYSSSDYEFVQRNAYKMLFYVNSASVVANLSITGVWTNASDARYKENITDSQYGLSTVMALKPRAYNLIDQTDKPQIGFIAQEVLEFVPEVVESVYNSITEQERYTLAYTQLIPVLTKAIQEQQAVIETLQADVAALKSIK